MKMEQFPLISNNSVCCVNGWQLHDYLTSVPSTSVEPEQAFSAAGYLHYVSRNAPPLTYFNQSKVIYFLPHLTNASVPPGKTQKQENRMFHSNALLLSLEVMARSVGAGTHSKS